MKKKLLDYKHIIWDWNGTLLDDVELCREIINEILKENALRELSLKKYREIFTFPVKKYYAAAGLNADKGTFEELGKIFISRYEERKLSCSLYPEAVDILEKIYRAGVGQSVLSAYSQSNLEAIIAYFNLGKYFSKLVGLDNIYAAGKLENGRKHISLLDINGADVLFIGDTLHDCEVADAVGVDSLLVAGGHQAKNKLTASGADVVDSLKELI